nr:MAG TPA: hypothetical protein [Bacteriophage sp.]
MGRTTLNQNIFATLTYCNPIFFYKFQLLQPNM